MTLNYVLSQALLTVAAVLGTQLFLGAVSWRYWVDAAAWLVIVIAAVCIAALVARADPPQWWE